MRRQSPLTTQGFVVMPCLLFAVGTMSGQPGESAHCPCHHDKMVLGWIQGILEGSSRTRPDIHAILILIVSTALLIYL
ncbi:hypothetical protein GGR58DRAFT_464317 [Xylaria digitata]|nr:hypothetical protein GGR58DRAFT_464317 [Xylaria digitata]